MYVGNFYFSSLCYNNVNFFLVSLDDDDVKPSTSTFAATENLTVTLQPQSGVNEADYDTLYDLVRSKELSAPDSFVMRDVQHEALVPELR